MTDDACLNPGQLGDGDLMDYVDGTADRSVVRHVRACPDCTRQAARLAAMQAVLGSGLHRYSCPEGEQLAAYEQGALHGGERLLVAQHLRQCPHCPRELAALVQKERSPLGERVRAALRVIVANPATPSLRPRAAQLRGPYSAPRVYNAEGLEIQLSQRTAPHQPDLWDISGLVHTRGQVPPDIEQARLELYQDAGLLAIAPVSDRGHFALPALEPGIYDLCLVWQGQEIRLEGIEMP